MEYQCEYCNKSFMPKRTDSLYCSHSCRQLAYVLRKATANGSLQGLQVNYPKMKVMELADTKNGIDNYPSKKEDRFSVEVNNLTDNKEYPSSIDEQTSIPLPVKKVSATPLTENKLPVLTDNELMQVKNELPVKSDLTNVNTDKKIAVNTDMEKVNTDKLIKQEQQLVKPEFKQYSSRFINDLNNIQNDRDNWSRLDNFFSKKDDAAFWISEKYRCLVECLLAFSEMKQIELNDLKEVCNGLTRLIQSRSFKSLHPDYPYIQELQELRERTRNICLKAGESAWIKYKLNKEQKQTLIITRFELSQFVPKRKFSELNFKEKPLNRKEEY